MRPLPIGIGDFKKLIDEGYAYVDKTLLIQELIQQGSEVTLIPRPRRFGKTLNLSMLRYFFEKSEKDTSYLFRSLNIWQDEKCRALQGQFPVIFLSLKDIKHESWEKTWISFKILISMAFRSYPDLLKEGVLDEREKKQYELIANETADQTLYEGSLFLLSKWLNRYHKKRVVLLIDEYDTPAHAAFIGGYYDELIRFLRNWLSSGLKDNPSLEKGVLTGILRIAKESIFSGLNNVRTFTLLNEGFQDKFGLTESEIKTLLQDYNLSDHWESVRKWYNGYRIGSCQGIYNPWSVLNCIANQGALSPYWINTSDNTLIRELLTQGAQDFKADIEELLKNGIVHKTIDEGIIFSDLPKKTKTVWSLLLFSGYLSLSETAVYGIPCQLRIPNAEVMEIYQSVVTEWFEETLQERNYQHLLKSLVTGDIATFSEIFQKFFLSAFSYFDVPSDEPERIYHSFVLGMLIGLKDRYIVKSNRESGYGRYDVMLIPKNPQDLGLVIEFKKASRSEKNDLEAAAVSALEQIAARQYDRELQDQGIRRIVHLGMAFEGKEVVILSKSLTY